MPLSRRKFILIAGSSAVIMAAGKAAIDLDQMLSTAIAAWSGPPSTEPDIRKRLLAYAILAPNPHNMQPWIAAGQRTEISYFPKGEFGNPIDDRPVAAIRLIPDTSRQPDPLFQQIWL
jgi:hypothetical protein